MMAHYDNISQIQPLQMPQTYVGHETSLRSPQTMDWQQQQQQSPFQFGGHPINQIQGMPHPQSPFGNGHHISSPVHQMYPIHPNNMQTYTQSWQQGFPSNMHAARSSLDFGTDHNFMNSGYAAPEGGADTDLSILYNVMGSASTPSATQPNTRPPTQPNTEPSSPVAAKKRKLNSYHAEQLRMTNGTSLSGRRVTEPSPHTSTHRQRKSFIKHEQPPTPLSKTPTSHGGDDEVFEEDDAEYDEDAEDDIQRSSSPPAPWPASKARPAKIDKPPLTKSSKSRKKSTASATSTKPPKARRTSSGLASSISRVPLSAEQKKANHTNSEQRRRDATARAYAELYDLVPEIQEMGKQSTMKKLEIVVQKVRDIKDRLEYLRGLMGQDLGNGRMLPGQILTGDMAHLQGWR